MKERIVRKELLENFTNILTLRGVDFVVRSAEEKRGYVFVATNLNSKEFRACIERAMCEKESVELHHGRNVISFAELMEGRRPRGPFHILSKNTAKYNKFLAVN